MGLSGVVSYIPFLRNPLIRGPTIERDPASMDEESMTHTSNSFEKGQTLPSAETNMIPLGSASDRIEYHADVN